MSCTEADVIADMSRFGKIERVRIPVDEARGGRPRGFAIVVFQQQSSAEKAIDAYEINVGMASVTIKEAYMSQFPRGGKDVGDKRDFQLLQRN